MDSQIETINTVERRVRVEIPWADVGPRLQSKMRELRQTARLPGFRPGKVPNHMLEKLFGKSVREELARDLVTETFQTAVSQHSMVPLTQPVVESANLESGEKFAYAARFEVAPVIEPVDYTGIEVRRRPTVVDEAKVESLLEAKRETLTELRPIPADSDRKLSHKGDVWTVDIEGTLGPERITRKDLKIEIGADREFIPGLSEALGELALDAVGTSRDLRFTPPQDNLKPEFRGHEAVLKIGFREVREKMIPAYDDDFARDTGEAETMDELRAKLRSQVEEEDKMEAERDARRRLVVSILNNNDFTAAPSMIAAEVSAQVDLYRRQLQQQGLTLAQLGLNENSLADRLRPQAQFNVRAFLLLDAIGKKEDIGVPEDEVETELKQLAEEQGTTVARLRATMEKNNQLLLLRAQLREEKILDFLMAKAQVTEAPDPDTTESVGGDSIQ